MVDISSRDKNGAKKRPLSPHIQVYEWRVNMLTSILHRASGIALAVGALLVVALLLSAAMGADCFHAVSGFLASPLGTFMLVGWSGALFFHMFSGLRHMVLDTGKWFDIRINRLTAFSIYAIAAAMTAAFWYTLIG